MTWFSGIVVYVIIWWVVFFTMLPIGVRSPDEAGVEVGPGHAPSAPVRPRLGLKDCESTPLGGHAQDHRLRGNITGQQSPI